LTSALTVPFYIVIGAVIGASAAVAVVVMLFARRKA
jgi:hypothetical protein